MSSVQTGVDVRRLNTELRSKWGWFVALGIALCALGFLAFGNLLIATMATVFYVGAMMIIAAVAQIIHAFQAGSSFRTGWTAMSRG